MQFLNKIKFHNFYKIKFKCIINFIWSLLLFDDRFPIIHRVAFQFEQGK